MAEQTQTQTDNTAYLDAIASAVAPLAQWLATGETAQPKATLLGEFAENAQDTRKKPAITAEFTRDQNKPENKPETTPQAMRRRRHSGLRL